MGDLLKGSVAYLLYRNDCLHPYRISRMLVLAAWEGAERLLPEMTVRGESFGFYIEEIPEILDDLTSKGCAIKIKGEGRKCFRYSCGDPPEIDDDIKEILDDVYERTKDLSDQELNRSVIKDDRYGRILEGHA